MFPDEIARLDDALTAAREDDVPPLDDLLAAAEAVVDAFAKPPPVYGYGEATPLQKAIWSPVARISGDQSSVHYTWQAWAAELEKQARRLSGFAMIVADLDRSPNGRHEGDAETEDPTGVSQGNPHIREGQIFGYTLGGDCYVMPPKGRRSDPDAWVVPREHTIPRPDGLGRQFVEDPT